MIVSDFDVIKVPAGPSAIGNYPVMNLRARFRSTLCGRLHGESETIKPGSGENCAEASGICRPDAFNRCQALEAKAQRIAGAGNSTAKIHPSLVKTSSDERYSEATPGGGGLACLVGRGRAQ